MHRSDLICYRTDKVLVHVNLNTHKSNAAGSSLVADVLWPSPAAADGGAADISFSAAEAADKLDPPPAGFSPARQPGDFRLWQLTYFRRCGFFWIFSLPIRVGSVVTVGTCS